MVQVSTNLTTRESARRERFEPTGNVTSTNVQGAIQQVDTEAAGKVTKVGLESRLNSNAKNTNP